MSGSKYLVYFFIALIAAACSPKVRPVTEPVPTPKKGEKKPVVKVQPPKEAKPKPSKPAKTPDIALLLPFGLDNVRAGNTYTPVTLREADIALDYYRGFKLALDSLTGRGYSFKLHVFDSRADKSQAHSLALNPAVRNSDLIVGPVFPEDLKTFVNAYPNSPQPVVSPLSAASPSTFKSPELVTVIPPLEYHARGAAKYITNDIGPKKIFVLKSGYSEENDYIIPFKKAIDSLSNKRIQVVYLTVIHGQLGSLIPQLSATGQNVFVMPSTDRHFLDVTLRGLDSLHNSYPVTLIGHPSWVNLSFLKPDLLERLDTHITSSDRIDYKAANTINFLAAYRRIYKVEPTAYAIKGFDEGLYFGSLLGEGDVKQMDADDFKGLHNRFTLKKTNLGWVNTHVGIYKYSNFELKKVE
ncbi:MAG TPA: hypothetical protein VHA56_21980 [Mucilaginibacter sp.]|nr:hypothetical protein [Mucilaginibacter sp.]